MKRFWLGAALLALFLVLGIFLSGWMTSSHRHISHPLSQACELAQTGDLTRAADLAKEASYLWQKYRNRIAVLADHTPMEEIDGLFAELAVFLRMDEPVHFSSTCARLVLQLDAMGEAHSISWWTVL